MLLYAEPGEGVMPAPVLGNAVDGLAVGMLGSRGFMEEIAARRMPLVAVNTHEAVPWDSVRFDDVLEGARATRHLIALGHRRIAFVGSYDPVVTAYHRLRWEGYAGAMEEAGLAPVSGGGEAQAVDARVAEILAEGSVTGLVCFNDSIALRAMRGLRARGLKTPRDVSTVSFDDVGYVEEMMPALTTVRLPFEEMGRRAAGLILERLEQPDLPARDVMLAGELIARESSGPPKGSM
jgi:LacI family transcriptional regulator